MCSIDLCCAHLITGVILRDSHGVAQVRLITGNKILRILKAKGQSLPIFLGGSDYSLLL